ncbi:MAG: hypothetical protein IKD27_08145 [Oscillospiraceae bacterium]|nr:hypothetical protein [Oscillospiraceae bacterium]
MADKKKSVAKAYVQVVPTVDGIKDTLTKELGGEVSSSFGDIFKGTLLSGALLGAAKEIGGAVLDIGRDAVEAAAEVKAANAQFEQTFGELESTATAALRAVSNETGIAATRLKGGYTALYAFTKSVGGDSATALNIAKRAMSAAADSAAYYDRSVEDATETLQSFLKGNYANDAALGIAATETTRNAMANKLYAKSFIELSESQKVDTLLAMVEAGNKASGAMGQAAREADSWTNVTGELAEASRQLLAQWGSPIMEGLIPMIQGVTNALKGWTEQTSWEQLNQGIADFQSNLEAADESLTDSAIKMDATAVLAQKYVDRLRELEGAGLDTAESQREYKQVVELLNDLMPELSLTINEVTGRLEQNTWAIEDNIRSLREQAENQAKMAYYKTIIDEYSKALEEQFAVEQRLLQLQAEEAIIQQQLFDAEQMQMAANIRGDADLTRRTERVIDLTNALMSNREEQDGVTEAITQSSAALAAVESKLNAAESGYAELAGATGEATAAVDEQSEAVAALAEAYKASKDAARESIDTQIGLFEELEKKSEMSAEDIVKNWGKQQEAFGRYSDNLKRAVELGLDQTLVQQLSDGSQQSMLILDELLNGTELSIDEINAAFGGMSEARDTLAGTMADMEAIANGTYSDMVADAKNAGENVVGGLVAGIYEHIPRLESAMATAARKSELSFNRTMEINSPSRVMERAGGHVVGGAVLGVENDTWKLERAMEEMGERSIAAYNRNLVLDAAAYPMRIAGNAGFTGGGGVTNNHSYSLGGLSVSVYQQPGESADELVDRVIDKLSMMFDQGGAAIG